MEMLQRGLRRGWAGFIGGVFVGFGFLVYVPHMGSRVSDTIAVWAAVAIGAVVGVVGRVQDLEGFRADTQSGSQGTVVGGCRSRSPLAAHTHASRECLGGWSARPIT